MAANYEGFLTLARNSRQFIVHKNVPRKVRESAWFCRPPASEKTLQIKKIYWACREVNDYPSILTSGESQQSITFAFRVGKTTVCKIIREPTCYERRLDITGIPSELQLKKNRLLKDSVPTIDAVERQIPKGPTARQRRQIKRQALSSLTTVDFEEPTEVDLGSEMPPINEDAETGIEMQSQPTESDVVEVPKTVHCGNCSILKLKIRRYQQNIYKLKIKKQHLKDQIQTLTSPDTDDENIPIDQSTSISLPTSGFFEDVVMEDENIDLPDEVQEESDGSDEEWKESEWEEIEIGDLSDAEDQECHPTYEFPPER
eukprot:gene15524-6787_t